MITTFGERFGIALKITGHRQGEFAILMGVDEAWISNIVRGQREPSMANLRLILDRLPSVDARWLICGDES